MRTHSARGVFPIRNALMIMSTVRGLMELIVPPLVLLEAASSFEDRLGFNRRVGLISWNDFFRDSVLEQAFDIFQQVVFVNADQ